MDPQSMLNMGIMSMIMGRSNVGLLQICAMILMSLLLSQQDTLTTLIKNFFKPRCNHITFNGRINYYTTRSAPSISFSRSLNAVLHQLKKRGTNITSLEETWSSKGRGGLVPASGKRTFFNLMEDIQLTFSIKDENSRNQGDKGSVLLKSQVIKCTMYSAIRSSYALSALLDELIREYNEDILKDNNSTQKYLVPVYKDTGNSLRRYNFTSTRTFENLHFEEKKVILDALEFFANNIPWYDRTGSPHSLGFLFWGKPGTGKTSCIKAIANYTGRHILHVPLSELNTVEDLEELFYSRNIMDHIVPVHSRIILIEDIDCLADVVQKRDMEDDGFLVDYMFSSDDDEEDGEDGKKKKKSYMSKLRKQKKKITLSNILNCLDGVLESKNRIVIMTTNYPDKLDDALIRPGRIDYKIEFKSCTLQSIEAIVRQFFNYEIEEEDIGLDPNLERLLTPAQVSCICKSHMDDWHACVEALNAELTLVCED